MAHDDEDFDDLIDSVSPTDEELDAIIGDEASSTDLEDKMFSDDIDEKFMDGITPDASNGPLHVQEPTYAQPVNRATMVCTRGPCIHHWTMLARYVGPGKDRIHLKRIRQCNCHFEETALSGQNIYECSQWWPVWLNWVPLWLRGAMRPKLHAAYERALKHAGYDFSWKKWPDDLFESDRPELRDQSGLGGKRMHIDGSIVGGD